MEKFVGDGAEECATGSVAHHGVFERGDGEETIQIREDIAFAEGAVGSAVLKIAAIVDAGIVTCSVVRPFLRADKVEIAIGRLRGKAEGGEAVAVVVGYLGEEIEVGLADFVHDAHAFAGGGDDFDGCDGQTGASLYRAQPLRGAAGVRFQRGEGCERSRGSEGIASDGVALAEDVPEAGERIRDSPKRAAIFEGIDRSRGKKDRVFFALETDHAGDGFDGVSKVIRISDERDGGYFTVPVVGVGVEAGDGRLSGDARFGKEADLAAADKEGIVKGFIGIAAFDAGAVSAGLADFNDLRGGIDAAGEDGGGAHGAGFPVADECYISGVIDPGGAEAGPDGAVGDAAVGDAGIGHRVAGGVHDVHGGRGSDRDGVGGGCKAEGDKCEHACGERDGSSHRVKSFWKRAG